MIDFSSRIDSTGNKLSQQKAIKQAPKEGPKKDTIESQIEDLFEAVKSGTGTAPDSAKIKIQKSIYKLNSLHSQQATVKFLIDKLNDNNVNIRNVAAETLGVFGYPDVGASRDLLSQMIDPLIKLSEKEKDGDVRASIAFSLQNILGTKLSSADNIKISRQLSSMLLKDKDDNVRFIASNVKEFIDKSNNIPELKSIYNDVVELLKTATDLDPGKKNLQSLQDILFKKIYPS